MVNQDVQVLMFLSGIAVVKQTQNTFHKVFFYIFPFVVLFRIHICFGFNEELMFLNDVSFIGRISFKIVWKLKETPIRNFCYVKRFIYNIQLINIKKKSIKQNLSAFPSFQINNMRISPRHHVTVKKSQ